ncbi:MAG TPA: hypothetical protein VK657_01935, partial [Terriglobales bacterium]|nr:hypothetical protein [Terriglobales bacterium]
TKVHDGLEKPAHSGIWVGGQKIEFKFLSMPAPEVNLFLCDPELNCVVYSPLRFEFLKNNAASDIDMVLNLDLERVSRETPEISFGRGVRHIPHDLNQFAGLIRNITGSGR